MRDWVQILRVHHHQRLASSTPEDSWVVKAWYIDVGSEFTSTVLGRRGRNTERERRRGTAHTASWTDIEEIVLSTRLLAGPGILA